jgi:hypothetical protein
MTTRLKINSGGGVMNRLQLCKVVSVVLLACGLAGAQHITSISYPGSGTSAGQGTVALGINLAGAVVGYGPDGNFVVHSYVCVWGCNSPDAFTIVNAPGAGTTNNGASCFLPDTCQGTYAFSINAFGVIAGFYVDSDNVNHGFVSAPPYRTITTLNEADAGTGAGQGTLATNINLGGEIAGNYTDASGVSHGFVTAPPYTNFTSFDPTGSVFTLTAAGTALNFEGAVTGVYFDASGVLHGYVRTANGTITEYNVTGAGTASGQGTDTSGINDLGTITGPYVDSSGVNHGYLRLADGAITTFDASDAGTGSGQGTVPEGNNLLGEITGQYIDSSGVNHGFVRSPWGDITTFDAPGAGTGSGQGTVPETPNLFGQIAGFYLDGNGVYHGFLRTR